MTRAQSQPSLWAAHDFHILSAWRTHRLTDGTRLDFGGRREQTFKISHAGIVFVPPKETGTMYCPGGDVRDYAKVDYARIAPDAGGHTHLDRASSLPGPEDGSMAVLTNKPAYVISRARAFAIERLTDGFTVRLLGGNRFSDTEQNDIARRIASWNLNNGGSGVVCRLVPHR